MESGHSFSPTGESREARPMGSMSRRGVLARAGLLGGVLALGPAPPEEQARRPKVVVTGGHPGDPEYGCGGTIARYTEMGHEVVLLYLNNGEPAGTPPGSRGIRVAEARAACDILKARPVFAGQVDGAAVVDPAHYAAFRKIV